MYIYCMLTLQYDCEKVGGERGGGGGGLFQKVFSASPLWPILAHFGKPRNSALRTCPTPILHTYYTHSDLTLIKQQQLQQPHIDTRYVQRINNRPSLKLISALKFHLPQPRPITTNTLTHPYSTPQTTTTYKHTHTQQS